MCGISNTCDDSCNIAKVHAVKNSSEPNQERVHKPLIYWNCAGISETNVRKSLDDHLLCMQV